MNAEHKTSSLRDGNEDENENEDEDQPSLRYGSAGEDDDDTTIHSSLVTRPIHLSLLRRSLSALKAAW